MDDSTRDGGVDGVSRRALLRTVGVLAGVGSASVGFAGPVAGRSDRRRTRNSTSKAGGQPATDGAESPPPGPPVLYESPATAPQFENGPGWTAAPLLVSGADAYVDGEYLFQDFIYDDYGANTTDTIALPEPQPSNHDFGGMTGDVVYPTDDATYRDNAADLLEFRTRTTDEGTAVYRFTLNTMTDPDLAGIVLGIVTDPSETSASEDLGYGLGDLGIAPDHLLVTWGTGAELDGEPLSDDAVRVDTTRNQIEVEIPLKPSGATWRHYLAVGLFDAETRQFKQIGEQASEDQPGGAHGQTPPPVFNVGFRFTDQEPMGAPNFDGEHVGDELTEATNSTGSRSPGAGYGHWRDHAQARALADRDISAFHADIEFGTLADGVTERNVPESGLVNRLYATRFPGNEGLWDGDGPPESAGGHEDRLTGAVQPYAIYIPERYDGSPAPMHLHLHSLTSTYNQYGVIMPDFLQQVGERLGRIVLTPEARGPGQWYHDVGEVSVFEAWADARHRYELDMDRTTLGGYSMGGFGTYKLGAQWPDLFAKGFATVGPPDEAFESGATAGTAETVHNATDIADNLRHVPLLMWNGTNDELVPIQGPLDYEQRLRELGYRHELDIFPGYDHFAFGVRDQWGPGADFLEGASIDRAPPQVTYRAVPEMDAPDLGLVHDSAYWVSDIEVVDPDRDAGGLVDVRSHAFGEAPPVPVDYERPGTDPDPHTKRGTRWTDAPEDPPARNALDVDLDGVSTVTLWVEEAGIDPCQPVGLVIKSTHEATIVLAGSFGEREVTVPAGRTERTVMGDQNGCTPPSARN